MTPVWTEPADPFDYRAHELEVLRILKTRLRAMEGSGWIGWTGHRVRILELHGAYPDTSILYYLIADPSRTHLWPVWSSYTISRDTQGVPYSAERLAEDIAMWISGA